MEKKIEWIKTGKRKRECDSLLTSKKTEERIGVEDYERRNARGWSASWKKLTGKKKEEINPGKKRFTSHIKENGWVNEKMGQQMNKELGKTHYKTKKCS